MKFTSFLCLYLIFTFIIVPIFARPFGRVPLRTTNNLRPATIWTVILNRNYVKPELLNAAYKVSNEIANKYPGTVLNYLDASFPFINKYPLFPHLSHNDGKKLDLSFCYNATKTGQSTNVVPSPIGYGISEEPLPNETNTALNCGNKGYWQYSMLNHIIPQSNKASFTFNESKTKELVLLWANQDGIGKIFIEPHLVARLHLSHPKIRFHGCHAVRHDDHLHVQLK